MQAGTARTARTVVDVEAFGAAEIERLLATGRACGRLLIASAVLSACSSAAIEALAPQEPVTAPRVVVAPAPDAGFVPPLSDEILGFIDYDDTPTTK